jgi:hypothetical protein
MIVCEKKKEEEKGVYKDHSTWKEVISVYLYGKRVWCILMYTVFPVIGFLS